MKKLDPKIVIDKTASYLQGYKIAYEIFQEIKKKCMHHNYEIDENGKPTFAEIANLEQRRICQEIYEESVEYYKASLQERTLLLQK